MWVRGAGAGEVDDMDEWEGYARQLMESRASRAGGQEGAGPQQQGTPELAEQQPLGEPGPAAEQPGQQEDLDEGGLEEVGRSPAC